MKSRAASQFLILLLLAAMAAARKGMIGGWHSIEDVKNPHIQEIGKFAVTQHNANSKAGLVFNGVLSGESQVVAGINYRLVISVKDGKSDAKFQAVVWEKPRFHSKELTSFKPLSSNSPVKPNLFLPNNF